MAIPASWFLVITGLAHSAGAQSPLWTRYYDGPGSGDDLLAAQKIDGEGFVYLTGQSRAYGDSHNNIWTTKLSPDGAVEWENRFNGPANKNDYPSSIAVDHDGNVIVCGASWVGSAYSMITIKYSPTGLQRWASFYKHQSSSRDYAFRVVVDAKGLSYVAGRSTNNGTLIKLLKYDSDGSLVWSAQSLEPVAGSAEPTAMLIDHAGDIVIACKDGSDFLIIKFSPDGQLLWSARYDTPEHGIETPRAMGIDAQDNIYVTGSGGIYPDRDFITVSFDANGSQRWVARHSNGAGLDDFAVALAMDPDGGVIVTGTGDTPANQPQCLTIKYSLDGVQQWISVFPSNDDGYGFGTQVTVTPAGLIQVAGAMRCGSDYTDFFVIQYDANGKERWEACYNGPADWYETAEFIACDAAGHVYASGNSNGVGTWSDIATIKYDANGSFVWVNRYNVVGRQHDWPVAIAQDSLGHVYVGGASQGTETYDDFVVVKYDGDGGTEWVTRYSSSGPHYDALKVMTVDKIGNVYAAGYTQRGNSDFIVTVVAMDPAGAIRWVGETEMPTPGGFDVSEIILDPEGSVLVAATFFDIDHGGESGALVMKYSPSGTRLWSVFFPADSIESGGVKAMAVDPEGNINVAVSFYRETDPPILDTVMIQCDKYGDERWSAICDGPTHTGFLASSIVMSPGGDIFVCGTTDTYPLTKIALVKYDRDGSQEWAAAVDDGSGASEYAQNMAIDPTGNVILTGLSVGGSGSIVKAVTVKYAPDGQERWIVRDDSYYYFGAKNDVAVDDAANVFVSYTVDAGSRTRPAVRMIDSNGVKRWVRELPSQVNSEDAAIGLSLKTSGVVFLLSNSFQDGGGSDLATTRIDYCPRPGDSNQSETVDALDIQRFIDCLLGYEMGCRCADGNFDGSVNQLDIPILISMLLQ